MYQQDLTPSFHEIKTFADTDNSNDLFTLFDKFPNTYPLSFSPSNDKTEQQQPVSVSTSANVSPYMSERECIEQPETEDPESPGNHSSKSRRASLNKAERRAEHNAIERARRECLNSKFQQLAEVLPNLKNHRRPSKGQIVEKALDWVKINMTKEDRYQYQIIQLQNENKRLMSQINFTHGANSNSGVVTPPITSTSPSVPPPPPFPTTFRHQRFSSDTASISNEQNNHNNNIELSTLYNNQPKEINLMYPIVPLGVDWQNQSALNNSYDHNLMPSASSSSSSNFLRDDDNESNSSNEELQKHHIQMSFQDMSQCPVFEMGQAVSIPPWSKIQQHIPHPTSYRLSYAPSTIPGENLNYNNHSNSYLS